MGIGEDLKGAWSGDGRKWLIGGAVLGVGYLWYTRVRSAGPGQSGAGSGATITDGGAAVADPITPPGGDYSEVPEAPARPATNGEWLSQATDKLVAPPHNRAPSATWNALNNALNGQPLSATDMAIVELAIRIVGTPPEGMPPLNMTTPSKVPVPSTPTTPTTPPAPAPAPKTPAPSSTRIVKSGDTLSGIASDWRVTTSAAYQRNAAAIEAAAKAHGRTSSRGGPSNSLGWYIYPGTVLYKP